MLLRPIVVIPARMGSTRLPGKPLVDIRGIPMIVWVWRQGVKAEVGEVVVAAEEPSIVEVIEKVGGCGILTSPFHPSGTDRVHEALSIVDSQEKFNVVLNLQGDLPTISPQTIRCVLEVLSESEVDIATAVVPLNGCEVLDENIVKAFIKREDSTKVRRVEYFSRTVAAYSGTGIPFYHIGIYAFRRTALCRFVGLPPTLNERQQRLEQLRALEDGMVFAAALVEQRPFTIDTLKDLDEVRNFLRSSRDE